MGGVDKERFTQGDRFASHQHPMAICFPEVDSVRRAEIPGQTGAVHRPQRCAEALGKQLGPFGCQPAVEPSESHVVRDDDPRSLT